MTYLSVHQHHDECLDTNTGRRALNFVDRMVSGLILQVRLLHRRKHLKALGNMSHQQLSDIGLERGDIYEASKLARNVDVTCHLARVAKRRRG